MNVNPTVPRSQQSPPRRNFLWNFGAIVVGALGTLGGVLSGLWTFADPLTRRPKGPGNSGRSAGPGPGFQEVAALDAIPEDGQPRRFPVIADQMDAWNYTADQPVGAVYLRREANKPLQVFHSTCPHAGCSVSVVGAAFHCPCHNSSFDLTGQRNSRPGKTNPAPRDLDTLEYKIVDGKVWVKFQNFYTGRPEKKSKT